MQKFVFAFPLKRGENDAASSFIHLSLVSVHRVVAFIV